MQKLLLIFKNHIFTLVLRLSGISIVMLLSVSCSGQPSDKEIAKLILTNQATYQISPLMLFPLQEKMFGGKTIFAPNVSVNDVNNVKVLQTVSFKEAKKQNLVRINYGVAAETINNPFFVEVSAVGSCRGKPWKGKVWYLVGKPKDNYKVEGDDRWFVTQVRRPNCK